VCVCVCVCVCISRDAAYISLSLLTCFCTGLPLLSSTHISFYYRIIEKKRVHLSNQQIKFPHTIAPFASLSLLLLVEKDEPGVYFPRLKVICIESISTGRNDGDDKDQKAKAANQNELSSDIKDITEDKHSEHSQQGQADKEKEKEKDKRNGNKI